MVAKTEQAPVVFGPSVAEKFATCIFGVIFVAPLLWVVVTRRAPLAPSLFLLAMSVITAWIVLAWLISYTTLEQDEIVVSGLSKRRIDRSRVVRAQALYRSILVSVEGEANLEIPLRPNSGWKKDTRAADAVQAIHDWAGITETVLAVPSTELPQDARSQAVLATWEPSTVKTAGYAFLAVFLWLGLLVRLTDGSDVVSVVFHLALALVGSVALFRAAISTVTLHEDEIIVKGVLRTRRAKRWRVHRAAVGPAGLVIGVRGENQIQMWGISKGTFSTLSQHKTSADDVVDAINDWAEG